MVYLRTRLHLGIIPNEQISRDLQRWSELSFGNTQDILNISIGSVLEHEQDEEPVIKRDETQFSDEGLTDGEWKKHLLLEELIGSMFSAKVRVFSNSMFCTSATLQVSPIGIEWHLCPGDTSVQIGSCRRRRKPLSFSRQDHLREHVQRHLPLGKLDGAKINVKLKLEQEKWLLT